MSLFKQSKILVIGDAILDKYIFGSTNRISPEAPVPVLKIEKDIMKPGGAANVAANISSLGLNASLVANIGIDNNGKVLRKIIKSLNIEISKLEKRLLRLNNKLDEANLKLADPELYKDNATDDLQDLIRNQLELSNEVDIVDQEWMDKVSKLDSLT